MRLFKLILKKTTGYVFLILWSFCLIFLILNFGQVKASFLSDLRDDLRSQNNFLQDQIESLRQNIQNMRQQEKTLKNQLVLLDAKIKIAQMNISQIELIILQVENEIKIKDDEINDIEKKLDYQKIILAEHLREINNSDQQDLVEAVLANDKLSDVFDLINSSANTQQKIQEGMVAIKQLKQILENERQILQDSRGEINQLKVAQMIQRHSIVLEREEKDKLLTDTKGQEILFQAMLAKAKTDIKSVKEQLYLLEGVGVSMPLEQALFYAQRASNLTGIRPAFLLAVLKRETSWGEQVGSGSWRQDMNPRDRQAFIQICESLNIDPDKTAVSRKPIYGWGGAMGPAQFLPSVWLSYEKKIAKLTGNNPPNPWNLTDAFVAAALKLAENGADERTQRAEWKAAQIYFAGTRWNNPVYYFYGDQVMDIADLIQGQLDLISQ